MRSGNEAQDRIIAAGCDRGCGSGGLVDAVRAVCARRFGLDVGLEWGCLDNPGLRGAAEDLARVIGALQHQQCVVLGLIDERKAFAVSGSRDAADWAAGRLGMSRRTAVDEIGVAKKFEAFPALAEKAASGELSPEQTAPALDLAESAAAICDDDPQATAELETGEPLATDTARRLVCDSRMSVLVQDKEGRAVGIGTTARTVTPGLRRALTVRDGHCRFGDCTSRGFLHGHHIEHWPAPTEMSNLALVCHSHHHALHEGGWHLTGDPAGELIAIHPDGRRSPPNHPQTLEDTG
jgi:hypothetical protein